MRNPDGLDGTVVGARGLGLVVDLGVVSATPTAGWLPHRVVGNARTHKSFPGHVLWKDHRTRHMFMLQRLHSEPDLVRANMAIRSAFGFLPGAMDQWVDAVAYRIPMVAPPDADIEVPTNRRRNRRVGEPVWTTVRGTALEMRLSATVTHAGAQLYAEAFVDGHERPDGRPRSLLFGTDLRRLSRPLTPTGRQVAVSMTLRRLLEFAAGLSDKGVFIDSRRRIPSVASVRTIPGHEPLFDVRMPGVLSQDRFAAIPVSPFVVPVGSDADVDNIIAVVARSKGWTGFSRHAEPKPPREAQRIPFRPVRGRGAPQIPTPIDGRACPPRSGW